MGEEEMDRDLWSTLPEDIVLEVITFLPWYSLIRFRTVCVKWNMFLQSAGFAQSWAEHYRAPTKEIPLCCIGCTRCGHTFLCPPMGKCQATRYHCSNFHSLYNRDIPRLGGMNRVRIIGAAGGLLLLQNSNPRCPYLELFLMNPAAVEKTIRVPMELLPRPQLSLQRLPLGLVWDERSRTHRVLVLEPLESDIRFTGFHSFNVQNNSWERIARWPLVFKVRFKYPSMCKGQLFCLGYWDSNANIVSQGTEPSAKEFHVYQLDSSNRNWLGQPTWFVGTPSLPKRLHFANIWRQKQELMLAGGTLRVEIAHNIFLEEFWVWKLAIVERESRWVEVEKMPSFFVDIFNRYVSAKEYTCEGCDKFLCVASSKNQAAILDLHDNSWSMLRLHAVDHSDIAEFSRGSLLNHQLELVLCEPRFDLNL